MPAGLSFDVTQSYIAFAAVKFIGYSASTFYFNRRYPEHKANPLLFGTARTLLGMSLGAIVGLLGLVHFELAFVAFIVALIPFRIVEWYLTLKYFYGVSSRFKDSKVNDISAGIGWSFVLDVPALIGFLATGGLWIC